VVTRIGGSESMTVDVRVLSATNKSVEHEIAEGRFREDLFYRLNVVPIHVPARRDRRDDIRELVTHFVAQLEGKSGIVAKPFLVDAIARLENRQWQGNVRELRNAVERLLILSTGRSVTATDVERLLPGSYPALLSESTDRTDRPASLDSFRQDAERLFLLQKLRENNWNVSETARALGMPRSNLYKRMEKLQLNREAK
jgi:two-component system nitrogen regulation response regulator NtrX